jgi:ketosteroid isomerase-like protein
MEANKHLIQKFYTAFQEKDVATMQACYADDAVFSDPVFQNLNATQVRAMWEMLIKKGKDMRIKFNNISATEHIGKAEWNAHYTFSTTGNRVVNRIKATFILKDGKIIQHNDHFNFHTWARQALGITGLLLGWTPILKSKIRRQAMKNLSDYQKQKL